MPNVGTASIDIDVDGHRLGSNIRRAVNSQSSGITSTFRGLGRVGGDALSAGFSGALHLVEKVGLAAGVASVALGGFGLKVAGDFQQTRIAFEGILGSAEKAQSFLTSLRDFAAKTPFEFPELATASKSLLAVGFAASDVIPIMTKLGNVAATLGVGGEAINGVVRALGQMKGKGKASAEELNQISEQIPGFSAVKAIAEKMGVSTAEAFKKMETGAVSADLAIEAILEGMERFPGAAGAMERQSKTLNGVISTLKDTFRDALIDGIEPFLPAISDGLVKAQPLIKRSVDGLIGVLKGGIDVAKTFAFAFRFPDAIDESRGFPHVVATLGRGGRELVDRFREAWPQIRQSVTNAVGSVVGYVQDNWPKIKGVFESGLDAVRGAIDLAVPVVKVFANVADDLVRNLPTLAGALGGVGGAFRSVGGFVADHIEGFSQLAEIIGVIMVARLVALKVQLGITFAQSVIQSIISFTTATQAASVATTGLGTAAAGTTLSLGGLVTAAALLTGGLVILWRTTIDNNTAAEKWTIRGIELARQIPIVGGAVAELATKVAGLTENQIEADRATRSLTDRLIDYARGWHATVTIDTSQARQGIQNLRDDLALLNNQIEASGPGGGRGAARAQVQEQLDQESAGSNNENLGTAGDPGNFEDPTASMPDRAHGMDEGPLPGPPGKPMLVRAHAGEWVLTPEQYEGLTSGRSGGAAVPDAGAGHGHDIYLDGVKVGMAVAAGVSKGQHKARRP